MSTIRPGCGGGGVGVDRKWRVATMRLLHGYSSSLSQLVYSSDAPCYLCACTLLCVSNKVRTSRAERRGCFGGRAPEKLGIARTFIID